MRGCEVQNRNGSRFRLLKEVLSGNYPERDVSRMNVHKLEAFVLQLVEFTSVEASAKTVATIDSTNKPKWWPSDVLINKSLRDKESVKRFRCSLKQLIINCCDFFREYKQQWLPPFKSLSNDENFDYKVKGEKRKTRDADTNNLNIKKRKTLLNSKNGVKVLQTISVPDVCIPTYIPVESPIDKPLDQAGFLSLFNLGLNNNEIPKEIQLPNPSRLVKLHNCPHIPLSSDVGKAILKRENYSVPEYVTIRKIERVEWYINKVDGKISEQKFETGFHRSKSSCDHVYKFPIKQYHQIHGNIIYNDYLLKRCKLLTVVLKKDDLFALKNQMNASEVKLNLTRLSCNQLKKYLCKEATVVLEKKEVQKNYKVPHKQLTVLLERSSVVKNCPKRSERR